MSTTFTFPAFADQLRTSLLARTHLTTDLQCSVHTGPIPDDTPFPDKAIIIIGTDQDMNPAGLGPQTQTSQKETYLVNGLCTGVSPLPDETGVKAARDACLALLEELNQQLREDTTVTGTVEMAAVTSVRWTQGLNGDRGRRCNAEFTITVRARIAATQSWS